ncbi:MAG: hypothetical protein R3E39_23535 [Anaerolineae bacterium]
MPFTSAWYIENEIIYMQFSGAVTLDDMRASIIEANRFIESSPRPVVHLLSDVGQVTKALNPKDSLAVARETKPHARAGWNIVLREKSVLIKVGVMVGSSVFKVPTKVCDTLEEAIAVLKKADTTLDWDRANSSVLADQ